jgi:hypothetical protein
MAEVLFEFESSSELVRALALLSEVESAAGRHIPIEAYTPYSTDEVRTALGRPRSLLGWFVFAAGLLGACGAYGLQWYLVGYLYPLNVGSRPPHMPLAFVPITFEMGVLFAASTAFFGALFAGSLVRPWHPVFETEGFESVSVDRFWLAVQTSDAVLDPDEIAREAALLGALRGVVVSASARLT